jgi:Icc-related predicted phosphoesterase
MSSTHFQIISDIHISDTGEIPDWRDIVTKKAEVLIVAGDVGRVELVERYFAFMTSLCKGFTQVYLVPGNWEYYSNTNTIEYIESKLTKISANIPNLRVLRDESVDIAGGIRLYGTTLWSHIPESNRVKNIPIRSLAGVAGTPTWLNMRHFSALHHLEGVIARSLKEQWRVVVVSHYAPVNFGCLAEKHLTDPSRFYYANTLDRLLKKEMVTTWIYAHTHVNSDYIAVGGTRVVSNQYRGAGYDKEKVIQVFHPVLEE